MRFAPLTVLVALCPLLSPSVAAATAEGPCAPDNVAAWVAAGHALLQQAQTGEPQATTAAVMALEGPCQCGNTQACVSLAVALQWCPNCNHALQRATVLYERGCAQQQAVACLNLGMMRERDAWRHHDDALLAEARTLYEAACAGGETQGCGFAGMILLETRGEGARAVAMLTCACEAGESLACQRLVEAYALEMPGAPRDGASEGWARKRACLAGAEGACDRGAEARATDE